MHENPLNFVILNGSCLGKKLMPRLKIDYTFSRSLDSYSYFCYLISLAKTSLSQKKKKGFCLDLIVLSLLLPDITDLMSTYELVVDEVSYNYIYFI